MSGIPFKSEQRTMSALSVLVTGLMVALGILVLAGAATLRHVDTAWRHALSDRWTVETTSGDADKAVAALKKIPGIADARIVPAEEMRHLLQPWLHDAALTAQLPLPTLIDVVIDRDRPPSPASVAQ